MRKHPRHGYRHDPTRLQVRLGKLMLMNIVAVMYIASQCLMTRFLKRTFIALALASYTS